LPEKTENFFWAPIFKKGSYKSVSPQYTGFGPKIRALWRGGTLCPLLANTPFWTRGTPAHDKSAKHRRGFSFSRCTGATHGAQTFFGAPWSNNLESDTSGQPLFRTRRTNVLKPHNCRSGGSLPHIVFPTPQLRGGVRLPTPTVLRVPHPLNYAGRTC